MRILQIILPIAVGAFIGYCTNYIAIKMLFLPRKELYIGKRRIPFTPGVIPKNKTRLAAAVGKAVSEKLLTEQDLITGIENSGVKEEAVSKMTNAVMQNNSSVKETVLCVASETNLEKMTDKISNILTTKILNGIKTIDLHTVISDIATHSFAGLLSNPMVSMFLGGNALDSICVKIETAILQYIDQNGQDKLAPMVKQELENLLSKSIKSNLEQIDCSEEDIRNLFSNVVDRLMATNISQIISHIKIKDMVEAKINEMNVKELEDLVMSVMKNELQTVVNLGAVIGAIIGIINVFI